VSPDTVTAPPAMDIAHARSLLFVPAGDERRVEKALASDADQVIVDLEDAIAPSAKDDARSWVQGFLARRQAGRRPWLRINGPDTPWGAADMSVIQDIPLAGVVLPKASRQSLDALLVNGLHVIALVETAHGVREAYNIACHPDVVALMLGAADLGAEIGWLPRRDGLELLHARSALILDSAAAGIRAPFDAVHLDIRNPAALTAECETARSLGMGGKACIHPVQLGPIHNAFTPTLAEQAAAQRIVEAYDAALTRGDGAIICDGQMVDVPVVARARAVLAAAAHTVTTGKGIRA
jgi:citrate lyase beta subunit